jgi:hypothetical protein
VAKQEKLVRASSSIPASTQKAASPLLPTHVVATLIGQEPEAPAQNRKNHTAGLANWMIQFCQL